MQGHSGLTVVSVLLWNKCTVWFWNSLRGCCLIKSIQFRNPSTRPVVGEDLATWQALFKFHITVNITVKTQKHVESKEGNRSIEASFESVYWLFLKLRSWTKFILNSDQLSKLPSLYNHYVCNRAHLVQTHTISGMQRLRSALTGIHFVISESEKKMKGNRKMSLYDGKEAFTPITWKS